MDRSLVVGIESVLGSTILRSERVHGGDVAIAYAMDLADGRRVFVKTHRAPPPGFFTTEARGLSWLADAHAVDVPTVLAVSDGPPVFLALSWIDRECRAGDRRRSRAPPRRTASGRFAVLRARGPPHDREPGAAQRADGDMERVP